MLKLTGAALIIAACGAWGFMKSAALKNRAAELRKITAALGLLSAEVSYGKRDMKTVFRAIGEVQGLPLFARAAENMAELSAEKSLAAALSDSGTALLGGDREILGTMAQSLGKTNSKTQLESIEYARVRLEAAEKNASEEYLRLGRLYRSSGVLVGAMAAIILL